MNLTKQEVISELCTRSFYRFTLEAFKSLHNGQELNQNWHIELICNKLQEELERIIKGEERTKHLVINIPPRTLKSELVNVFFSVYCWVRKSSLKFISSSYSASLSIDLSTKARRLIESDWFINHFPNVQISKDENTKSKYTTPQGGLRYCTSTGGTVTGMGADIVVIDDPQNPQLARSEVERENANQFFNETLRSRLNQPEIGVFIVIMQRLHENDLTGMLLKKEPEEWQHICLPAEVSDNVLPIDLKKFYKDGLLFSQRLSKKVLSSFKKGLGSYGYSGQYSQLPSPADGGILKGNWVNIVQSIKDENNEYVNLDNLTWDFFFDTAYTKKQENDPSALLSCSYYNNNLYIRKVEAIRLEFPELVKEIPRFCEVNGYDRNSIAYVEPKASGKSVVQYLKQNLSINIVEGETPTTDKVSRANSVSAFIESGRCYLLEGNWNESFLNEVNSFPNGIHDDKVDVLVMAIDELAKEDQFYFV